MGKPVIEYTLVCDDTRREDNGKLILIGVYGANILVSSFPAALTLSLVSFIRSDSTFEAANAVRAVLDGETLTEGGGVFRIQPGRGISVIPTLPLTVPHAGEVIFEQKIGEDDWQTLVRVPVGQRATSASVLPVLS